MHLNLGRFPCKQEIYRCRKQKVRRELKVARWVRGLLVQAGGPTFKYPSLRQISGCSSNPDRARGRKTVGACQLLACQQWSGCRPCVYRFLTTYPRNWKEELIHICKRSEMILFEANWYSAHRGRTVRTGGGPQEREYPWSPAGHGSEAHDCQVLFRLSFAGFRRSWLILRGREWMLLYFDW